MFYIYLSNALLLKGVVMWQSCLSNCWC